MATISAVIRTAIAVAWIGGSSRAWCRPCRCVVLVLAAQNARLKKDNGGGEKVEATPRPVFDAPGDLEMGPTAPLAQYARYRLRSAYQAH
jgi:hypothetical protein